MYRQQKPEILNGKRLGKLYKRIILDEANNKSYGKNVKGLRNKNQIWLSRRASSSFFTLEDNNKPSKE